MTIRACSIRMKEHQSNTNSKINIHNNLPGHKIDFENVKILNRAITSLKLSNKEISLKKCPLSSRFNSYFLSLLFNLLSFLN